MFEVRCPSGFAFMARKFQLSELRELSEAAENRDLDGGLSRILGAVWLDLVDPGPYSLQPGTKPSNWDAVLEGDALVALRKIRVESIGKTLEFNFACEHCGKKQEDPLLVDLAELKELPYSEEALSLARSKGTFELQLTEGKASFRLPTIGGHRRVLELKTQYKLALKRHGDPRAARATRPQPFDFILQCLATSEALGENIRNATSLMDWVGKLELGDFYAIKEALEERAGGLDTTLKNVICGHCDWEQDGLNLPLDGAFWARPKKVAQLSPSREL